MRIDAHQHFWRFTPEEYGWIDGRMAALQRDFLPSDLAPLMRSQRVDATIAVQARQTLDETDWLVQLAGEHEWIAGIVGWAPIVAPDFAAHLDRLQDIPRVKGLRHVVQDEPSGFLARSDFNRGISLLGQTPLVYELLIYSHQLDEATGFVDRHPNQLFVLDHIAKPKMRQDDVASWRAGIAKLARRQQVVCKISGMVTEADWSGWTPDQLQPYLETVLKVFGPGRLMVGSDWPVMTVSCTYARWWQLIADWLNLLTASERKQIEGGVAGRVYRLELLEGKTA